MELEETYSGPKVQLLISAPLFFSLRTHFFLFSAPPNKGCGEENFESLGAEKRTNDAEKRTIGAKKRTFGAENRTVEKKWCGEEKKWCGEEKLYFGATVVTT